MTDKMREAIIQFGQDNPSLDLDFRLHTHGKYLTQEKAIVASRAFKAGAAWQAAQSAAVPVVGDVVAWRWIRLSTGGPDGGRFFDGTPSDSAIETAANSYIPCAPQLLVVQPTTSITAAELDALRKESQMLTWLLNKAELVHQGRGVNHWQLDGIVFDGAGEIDLGSKQFEIREAIDAAIAGEKNHG